MNINYKESQTSLFPETVTLPEETGRPHFMSARLTLSVENLVISTIVSIMVVLFAFSIGVERGKWIALSGPALPVSVDKEVLAARAAGLFGSLKAMGKSEGQDADVKAAVPQSEKMKAQAPAADPVVKPAPSGAFTVQVASYKTEKGAQKEATALKQKGYRDVFVVSKGSYVILCVGDFESKDEASLFGKSKLKSRYQDLRVRSL